MTALVRAVITFLVARHNETPEQFMARRYPHLAPNPPWSDGTDL